MKSSSADCFLSYTNGEADLQFSTQLVRSQVEMSAKRLAIGQRDAIDKAVKKAASEGAKGLRVTWAAPKIEVME